MSRSTLAAAALLLGILAAGLAARVGQAPARVAVDPEAIRQNNLGVATMNQQKFEDALPYFERAAAAAPGFHVARVNQAIALVNLQRYEPARALLQTLTKEAPDNPRVWYSLGLLQRSLGESETALASFRRAIELRPRDAHARYFAGLVAAQLQQYDEAIELFRSALAIDPFHVSAEFGLARAFQRKGDPDQARGHMERFTRLTQEKVASPMSLAYGDQGPLSLAEAVRTPAGAAPPAIDVRFAATDLGASLFSGGTGEAVGPGPGGCFLDANGDAPADYLAIGARAGAPAATLYLGRDGGRFERAEDAGLDAPGPAVACAAGDLDNDERTDLVVSRAAGLVLYRNAGEGRFEDVTAAAGVTGENTRGALGVSLVDYDHDADLDLVVAREGAAPALWRNNGDGTFTDVTEERGFSKLGPAVAAIASDLNNDRAVDLILTGGVTAVLLNPREGPFTPFARLGPEPPRGTRGVVVLDFDKDGWMDLAFTHEGEPGLSLWRNEEGASFARAELPAVALADGFGLAAVDYDNDGWMDLAATGTSGGSGRLVVLRNVEGRFEDATAKVAAGNLAPQHPRALLVADVDLDADADLVITSPGAAPTVLRNEGGSANRAVRLALRGLNDNRSGFGTKVEVQAGTVWQKLETVSASGYLGQSAPDVLAGIGAAAPQADVVRLLWPTGVVQDEVQQAAGARHEITQIDRRGSSCPVLFSWDGERYTFIADAIGPAVVGHWVAPGTRNIPDVDEYVKVDGRHVKPKDGRLSFRFAEPMEEVIYLDQVKLFAVDHPEGTEVNPNEYFAALPPHPEARVVASRGARLPLGAWDDRGRDVLGALRARDRRFVDTFEPGGFKGFAKLHALELDLGEIPAGAPVRLLMHGFTDYFTANSVFAAHQANVTAILPYVEVQRPDGTWTKVIDDIGFPAGLLRSMTADLTGKLPAGTRRIRIWTNLKVYWDEIRIDTTPEGAVPFARTEIPLAEASLAYRGFPRELTGTPETDLQYVHDEVSPYGPYARHRGFYTRYGDVRPLLLEAEDHFAIFGAGDEVALEFDAAALPPLAAGWTRDYFVYFNGYVKDMDFYAAHAQTVAPLPFKSMPGYPYGDAASYPDRHLDYLLEWNTREVAAEAWPSYRFDY